MNDRIETPNVFHVLAFEHRLILRVLGAFEHYLAKLEEGAEVDGVELARFVTFFREFVDLTHHVREERVLFPALNEHGFSNDIGPLAHIREQHDVEREYLWRLMKAVARGDLESSEAKRELCEIGRAYVRFQRAHLEKESSVFYPAARRELTLVDLHRLKRASARFDHAPERPDSCWLIELGESLVQRHSNP